MKYQQTDTSTVRTLHTMHKLVTGLCGRALSAPSLLIPAITPVQPLRGFCAAVDPSTDLMDDEATDPTALHVGNLAWQVDSRLLRQAFSDFNPTQCFVAKERGSGRSHGYGVVRFNSPEAAQLARAIDGQV